MPTYLGFILICAILLFLWWFSQLDTSHRVRRGDMVADELEKRVAEREAEIGALQEEIESLKALNLDFAKRLHDDNKLLRAMRRSLRESLDTLNFSDTPSRARAEELLRALDCVEDERDNGALRVQQQSRTLPATGLAALDQVLRDLAARMAEEGTDFQLRVDTSVRDLADTVISEKDLRTLTADLVDNARIAVRDCAVKSVMLCFGVEDGRYYLRVTDSGAPFPVEVLAELGARPVTGHAEDGGHGLGLYTAFELLRRCGASFELDETLPGELFQKRITVRFDGENGFRIKSERPEVQALDGRRRDLLPI